MLILRPICLLLVAALAWASSACSGPPPTVSVQHGPSPAPSESLLPQLTKLADGAVAATWLEPIITGGYHFKMAVRRGSAWSEARTITSGPDLVMFSADLPGLVEMAPGRVLAYWQRRDRNLDDSTATVINVSQSTDEGRSWTTPIVPHRDGAAGSHSFLAGFPINGRAGLVWLDSMHQRYTPVHEGHGGTWLGAIGLRYVAIDQAGAVHDDQFVDTITCDCCPNASAVTARGPVVAYRDREAAAGMRPEAVGPDSGTVRDIYVARLEGTRWTTPVRVHADNWVINACPDNGPALDATGDTVVVAWWTLAGGAPAVKVAFSTDAGSTFAAPIRTDQGRGNGQVTVALFDDGRSAVVGWLEDGQTWARVVRDDGAMSPAVSLGTSPVRNRLPRWIPTGRDVLAMWTERNGPTLTARVSTLSLAP